MPLLFPVRLQYKHIAGGEFDLMNLNKQEKVVDNLFLEFQYSFKRTYYPEDVTTKNKWHSKDDLSSSFITGLVASE